MTYVSFGSDRYPLFFRKIDSNILNLKKNILFKNKDKLNDEKAISGVDFFELHKVKCSEYPLSKLILFPAVFFIVGFFLIIYYGVIVEMNVYHEFIVYAELFVIVFVSIFINYKQYTNRIGDAILSILLIVMVIPSMIYSLITSSNILFVDNAILILGTIIYIELVKSLIYIRNSSNVKCFIYGEKQKFLLITTEEVE